ncbi:MurR/RpiR family transcriptional regulator [Romboutsia sp.]|uniref:MurR/RpiR family transcriptional regulator n=1 Tax=Romboutsia sp. TaxID=1965302 RepID=UPI003F3403EC
MLELAGLIGCYNTYDQGDIYFQIAKSILENYNNLDMSSVQAFADSIHISVSTANRFIRQLYFSNFSEFRNYINRTPESYEYDGKYFPSIKDEVINPIEYGQIICDKISEVMGSIEEADIVSLVSIIEKSDKIIFIGIPIISAVWRLQMELILMGKKTSAFLDPNYQISEVDKVGSDSAVICLQHMRQQDDHNERLVDNAKLNGAKIIYIGSLKVKSIEDKADISIIYKGTNTQIDTTMTQIIVNYIGTYLRNKIINC